MIKDFLEILPKKLVIFLLVILISQILLSFGLNYISKSNERKIQEMNQRIDVLTKDYMNKFYEKEYKGILHLIAIDYLLTNRKKVNIALNNLPKYLPKNLKINSISIDNLNSKIKINGNLPNWIEYAKIKKYLESNQDIFPDFKIDNLSLDQQTLSVNLVITFSISPVLYQQ